MPPLSLKKIFAATVGIIALSHLRAILRVIQSLHLWFCESLEGMNDFSGGARTAIAVYVLLLIVVVTLKLRDKHEQ